MVEKAVDSMCEVHAVMAELQLNLNVCLDDLSAFHQQGIPVAAHGDGRGEVRQRCLPRSAPPRGKGLLEEKGRTHGISLGPGPLRLGHRDLEDLDIDSRRQVREPPPPSLSSAPARRRTPWYYSLIL